MDRWAVREGDVHVSIEPLVMLPAELEPAPGAGPADGPLAGPPLDGELARKDTTAAGPILALLAVAAAFITRRRR